MLPTQKNIISTSLAALLILLLTLNSPILGQGFRQYNIENISTEIIKIEKGLSQNSVRCIFEDHKGFMWFGTWDGLNRYDGTEFISFTSSNSTYNKGLVQQTVNAIFQDDQNTLWIGTNGGLSKVDYNNLQFKSIHPTNKSDTIHSIFQGDSVFLWLGTQRGIALIDRNTDSVFAFEQIYSGTRVLSNAEIRMIKKIGKYTWIGTANGLYKLQLNHKNKVSLSKIEKLSDPHITSLLALGDSILLIGTEYGLNTLNLKNNTLQKYLVDKDEKAPNSNVVMALMLDENQNIWIGTSGSGVYFFNLHSKKFKPFVMNVNSGKRFLKEQSNYDPFINTMYQSQNGIIWIGTAWQGLLKINEKQNIFKAFQKSNQEKHGLSDNHIWCFYATDTSLFIGTEQGVNIYNYRTHRFHYLNTTTGLSTNQIRSLYISSDSCLWIGTYKGGLNRLDTRTGEWRLYKKNFAPPYHISNNTIWVMAEDQQHQLWVGTYHGLNRINLTTGELRSYFFNPDDSNSISNDIIYDIIVGSEGHIWLGTYRGFCEYIPETDKFIRYSMVLDGKNTLSNNRIFSIYDDHKGNLWIGTVGGGLNKFNKKTKKVKWYSTQQGLPNNVVYAIIPDSNNNLWLSTNFGICRFNMDNESCMSYSVNDGLLSNELNKGAALKDQYGNIYFGGMFGFNVFRPSKIVKNNRIPPLSISYFKAYKQPPLYHVDKDSTIELHYNQNDFKIRYAVLDFTNPQKNQHKHRLIGYDRNWIITDPLYPVASYSRVEPGRYTFEVMGSNNDGIWNPEPLQIKIIIRPPWYMRPIFWVPLLLLIFTAIFLVVRSRINYFKKQRAIEAQLHEIERQALRLQMNPHFIFNTLNSIQAFILKNKTRESIAYLSKFSKLVRAILNTAKEPVLSLADEIEILQNYLELEQLRFDYRFDFKIQIADEVEPDFTGIAPMLIQPFVENAVLHGIGPLQERKGKISIRFSIENDLLKCEIEDNGVGRDYHKSKQNKGHKAKGMHISQTRLELINREHDISQPVQIIDLFDENGLANGTRIVLIIKFEEL